MIIDFSWPVFYEPFYLISAVFYVLFYLISAPKHNFLHKKIV
jgi:hypothetical protein